MNQDTGGERSYAQQLPTAGRRGWRFGALVMGLLPALAGAGELVDRGGGVLFESARSYEWTRKDNAADLDWAAAGRHCQGLALNGGGWSLPTLAQLQGLYQAEAADVACGRFLPCKVSPLFELSSMLVWSADQDGADAAYAFGFHVGERFWFKTDEDYNFRAICVRPKA